MKKILITGTAGFIGFHLANRLAGGDFEIIGLDNINDYYDVNLKYARLKEAGFQKDEIEYNKMIKSNKLENYSFIKLDLTDKLNLEKLFEKEKFDYVINLAAQAGVRYSLENPHSYVESNVVGFLNILESSRHNKVKHLIYASSSSVYGLNKKQPFSTEHCVDHPISIYAATKKSNELMAHTYSYLFNLPTTGLRFFTVYGPWGRPDMALFLFTKAIKNGEPIKVFNNGKMKRDFTYVDDIVNGIVALIDKIPEENPNWDGLNAPSSYSIAPYRVFNIGNSRPVDLMEFVHEIEKALGKKAVIEFLPMQPGDVENTFADVSDLSEITGYSPSVTVKEGITKFIEWYENFVKNYSKGF